MNKQRLLELAGVPLNEGPPKTTWENPLVTVWETAESKDYPESGIIGHMHLTTAQNIHQFKIKGLAEELKKAGVGKRIKAGKVWLEMSKWTKKEIDAGGQKEAVAAEKKLNEELSDVEMEDWEDIVADVRGMIDGIRSLEPYADDYAEIIAEDDDEREELLRALKGFGQVYDDLRKLK